MATLVVVHGGLGGAWIWDLLTPELAARGHPLHAMNLPVDNPEATQQTYRDTVISAGPHGSFTLNSNE